MKKLSNDIPINGALEVSYQTSYHLYDDKYLTKLLLELVLYLIFLTVITTRKFFFFKFLINQRNTFVHPKIVALNFSGESYYYLTKVVVDTFEEEKFSNVNDGEMNFKELTTVEEFWKVIFECVTLNSMNHFMTTFMIIIHFSGLTQSSLNRSVTKPVICT